MDTWWKAIGFYLIVCSLRIELNQALQLCQNAVITGSSVNLDMNSSPITSSSGMCSCKITLGGNAKISMFTSDIQSPDCKTNILLSDTSYTFTCVNEKIDPVPSYAKDLLAGNTLWVYVTSSGGLNAMSGTLQIKSKPFDFISDSQFTLQCFEPNTNTTETTPLPISTTTTTVTTTVTTSSAPPPPPSPTTTTTTTTTTSPTTSDSPTSPVTVLPQQLPTTTTKTSTQQPQPTTTDRISTTHTDIENTTSDTGSNNNTTGSTPASTSGSTGVVAPVDDDDKYFPVGAVVGGIIGGVAFIIIIILIAVCLRRRRKEPSLLESGQKQSKGHKNKGYDNGVPNIRYKMPKQSLYESTPVNLENGQRSNDAPRQNEPLDNDDMVEGSEVVVTSSGDIYAVVDKSNPERNPNISPSVYASVNKPKKPNVTFNTDPKDQSGSSDLYATVNKSRPDYYEEDEAEAISRMMQVPDEVLQDRISSVQSTAL